MMKKGSNKKDRLITSTVA